MLPVSNTSKGYSPMCIPVKISLQGARIVLEMEILWLLQFSKYWLYILPVLESFFFVVVVFVTAW